MANGTVTRSIIYARAYAWQIEGSNDDGSPKMEKVGGVEFRSTKPNKKEAFRALKAAGFKVSSQFVTFETEREIIIAQDLDTFIKYGVEVNRTENGRVKTIDNGTVNAIDAQ